MPPPNTATRLQVDTLVEPVVKQVAKWGCESSDFDMFVDVAKHPRLHLRAALRLENSSDMCLARVRNGGSGKQGRVLSSL